MRLCAAALAPGNWKLVLLKTLKTSHRNCSRTCSVIGTFLNNDISALMKLGPTNVLRPRLPTQPRHGALNGSGAPALNQPSACWAVVGVKFVIVLFGRSLAMPSRL